MSDDVFEARRQLRQAKIDEYVKRVVAEAPPLTDEQRDMLARYMRRDSQ